MTRLLASLALQREAQRALAAMVAGANRGELACTPATVGDPLEEWYAHAVPSFSPKNVVETRGVLDRNLLPFLGTVPLTKLGAADLDRFYRRLADKGGRRGTTSRRPFHRPPVRPTGLLADEASRFFKKLELLCSRPKG